MVNELTQPEDCRLLLAAATPDLYQANGFRITGLTVDVSAREVLKPEEVFKGAFQARANRLFALQPSPTSDQVRAALELLKVPQARIIHELFWFWPEEAGHCDTDPAFHALASGNIEAALRIWSHKENHGLAGAAARHNLAVYWHWMALEGERNAAGETESDTELDDCWRKSLQRWVALASDEPIWDRMTLLSRQLDESRLPAGFCRQLRQTLPQALGQIHVQLALRHTDNGANRRAMAHVEMARHFLTVPGRFQTDLEKVAFPAKTQLRQMAQAIRAEAAKAPAQVQALALRLAHAAQPVLDIFRFVYGAKENPACTDVFDEVAATCVQCLMSEPTQADTARTTRLVEQARDMAATPAMVQHLNGALGLCIGRQRLQPLRDRLAQLLGSDMSSQEKFSVIKDQIMIELSKALAADPYNPSAFEMRDALAHAFRTLALALAGNPKTEELAFAALDLAAQHACLEEMHRRIAADHSLLERKRQNRIEVAQLEGRRLMLANLSEKLDAIEIDYILPRAQALRIEQEILPYVEAQIQPNQKDAALDCVADALLRIAVAAWEDFGDPASALSIAVKAESLVRNPELHNQIAEEKKQAAERLAERERENLSLTIRDDAIKITSLGVQINETVLAAGALIGARFGDGISGGAKAFLIELAIQDRVVEIDCHRLLRNKAQTADDFARLTHALRIHIAPQIAGWIARNVNFARYYLISETDPSRFAEELLPSSPAMIGQRGLVLRNPEPQSDKPIRSSLRELRCEARGSEMALFKAGAPLVRWPLSRVWNAVFLPEIIKAIKKRPAEEIGLPSAGFQLPGINPASGERI